MDSGRAGGLVDFARVGDDFGNQRGPMMSPAIAERHFAPKYCPCFEMAYPRASAPVINLLDVAQKGSAATWG
jgi:hypothetical protein